MSHADHRYVDDFEARVANAPAKVEVLAVQEVALIETADGIEDRARQEQACARHCIDRFGHLQDRSNRHVDTRERRPSAFESSQPGQT